MSRIKIKDNSRIPKESLSGISLLTSKIADKTLEQLENEGIFVFPEILREADDITKDQMILQSVNNYYLSSNVMGFMGLGDEKLIVESRFSGNGRDFLFQYLLERVFDVPNIVDLETDANNDDRVFNLLVFIFPHYLKSAMRKGVFKTYVRKTYNDCNVKGTIDIARHIVKNTPFVGNVAYSQREYSFDNNLMELIRHTVEFIRHKPYGHKLLAQAKDEVKDVVAATPNYEMCNRQKIIDATGILRIAQESIFSGLNNLTVNSLMDEEYDSFFGFTESEVKAMLSYYGVSDKEEELKDWYDGYLFGSEEIYNPWSVINYISKGCIPQAYWVNTGKNEILDDVLRVATDDITERLYDLLQGERVVARIDQNVVYRSLAEDPANIYSLLLVAGYLKTPKKELQADGSYLCEVSIPNREIATVYKSEILSHFLQTGAITRTTANKIAESLYANDYKKLQSAIGEYMDKSIGFFDGGAEGFYHGLMLGLIALMDNQYKIKSNRESGDGRFDVSLIPREKRYPGIILELKWKEKLSDVELEKWSNEALKQIGELRCDSEMKEDGITEILKFGIAFSGKKVCVRTE